MRFPVVIVPALKVNGMAIFPFILVQHKILKHDEVLIRHETIHLHQELELLIIPFYILYLLNYLLNRLKYKDHYTAYLNIVFEREAYAKEADAQYLITRKPYSWFSFIKR